MNHFRVRWYKTKKEAPTNFKRNTSLPSAQLFYFSWSISFTERGQKRPFCQGWLSNPSSEFTARSSLGENSQVSPVCIEVEIPPVIGWDVYVFVCFVLVGPPPCICTSPKLLSSSQTSCLFRGCLIRQQLLAFCVGRITCHTIRINLTSRLFYKHNRRIYIQQKPSVLVTLPHSLKFPPLPGDSCCQALSQQLTQGSPATLQKFCYFFGAN